jgi:hypothetical protein
MDDLGRAKMKAYVDNLNFHDNTHMTDALERSFEILSNSKGHADATSGCGLKNTLILFLTDGKNSQTNAPPEAVIEKYNDSGDLHARMFTYTFGTCSFSIVPAVAFRTQWFLLRVLQSRLLASHIDLPPYLALSFNAGAGADGSLMKKLACMSGGVSHVIADDGDLKQVMASYFVFLAASHTKVCAHHFMRTLLHAHTTSCAHLALFNSPFCAPLPGF